jgi:hypothetical protein
MPLALALGAPPYRGENRLLVFIEAERAQNEGTRIDVALHWARHLATAPPAVPEPAP